MLPIMTVMPAGLGDGVDLERIQDAAGLHELDDEDVAGAGLGGGQRLARAADALVERDRHVHAGAHEARRLEVVHAHRLLDELDAVGLEQLDGAHSRLGVPPALVGVDGDARVRAGRFADGGDALLVALRRVADLDLEHGDAVGAHAHASWRPGLGSSQPQAMTS